MSEKKKKNYLCFFLSINHILKEDWTEVEELESRPAVSSGHT